MAIDAGTGKQIWMFDGLQDQRPNHKNRGLMHWTDGKESRIFFPLGYELLSIDAKTGKLDPGFGNEGRVDMRAAFDRPLDQLTFERSQPRRDLQRSGHSRKLSSRDTARHAWRHPRLQRSYRQTAVDISHDSSSGRIRS